MSSKLLPRLGVNIDHVATLRQARGENYPSVVEAAQLALANGADQITIHLREDRRHIQDTDVVVVQLVTQRFNKPLNLEMGCGSEIVDIALATSPDWVCLVPEKREEKTTEGGLDLLDKDIFERVQRTCIKLREGIKGLKISLFVECQSEHLKRCSSVQADAVEIHTGDFARAYLKGEETSYFFEQYKEGYELCRSLGMSYHAGHGLTDESTLELLKMKLFVEYNIGHWIISQSVFEGLGNVVRSLKEEFKLFPLG